jgi:hypothetical protein
MARIHAVASAFDVVRHHQAKALEPRTVTSLAWLWTNLPLDVTMPHLVGEADREKEFLSQPSVGRSDERERAVRQRGPAAAQGLLVLETSRLEVGG